MMLLQKCYHGFSSLLTGETCPLYAAPENGALACNELGLDYVCAVMCKNGFDFVSNPPMVYFCSAAQWQTFISSPPYPYSPQLPWPDCSSKLITERNLFFRSHASGKFHSALLRTLLNPLSRVEKKILNETNNVWKGKSGYSRIRSWRRKFVSSLLPNFKPT